MERCTLGLPLTSSRESGNTRTIWYKVSQSVIGVHTLVWYESHETMNSAITREKAIKEWQRAWKIALIEKDNPVWRDLYEDVC